MDKQKNLTFEEAIRELHKYEQELKQKKIFKDLLEDKIIEPLKNYTAFLEKSKSKFTKQELQVLEEAAKLMKEVNEKINPLIDLQLFKSKLEKKEPKLIYILDKKYVEKCKKLSYDLNKIPWTKRFLSIQDSKILTKYKSVDAIINEFRDFCRTLDNTYKIQEKIGSTFDKIKFKIYKFLKKYHTGPINVLVLIFLTTWVMLAAIFNILTNKVGTIWINIIKLVKQSIAFLRTPHEFSKKLVVGLLLLILLSSGTLLTYESIRLITLYWLERKL